MKHITSICIMSMLGLALLTWMGGCPQDATTNTTGTTDTSSLTAGEEDAAQAAAQAGQSLAEAVNVTKTATDDDDDQGSFDIPDIPTGSQSITFGQCPEVELEVTNDGLLTFDMSIDFGTTGCTPYGWDDYICTGSASGTFDQSEQNLSVTFESISCNEATLTGTADVNYDIDGQAIDLDGDWDLTYVDDIGTIQTDGNGEGGYNASTYVTTITSFEGDVTDTVSTWSTIMLGIHASYPTYGSYIPYSGTMTVSGPDIRTMTVRFNEDSPTTGVVEVSIGGAPYFNVNLYSL